MSDIPMQKLPFYPKVRRPQSYFDNVAHNLSRMNTPNMNPREGMFCTGDAGECYDYKLLKYSVIDGGRFMFTDRRDGWIHVGHYR